MNKKLTSIVFSPKVSVFYYSAVAFFIAIIPSFFIMLCILLLAHFFGLVVGNHPVGRTSYFRTAIFAPVIETLLLILTIRAISLFADRKIYIALCSAFLWAALHSAISPLWFFGVFWSFFVFSISLLVWHEKSFFEGFLAAFIPHFLINSVTFTF